ncbi:MAG: hypothetical protein Q8P18_11600 [Pseudomonadota bacterium]|nr:hypothetical protein [Pseudomonadota bacterium]
MIPSIAALLFGCAAAPGPAEEHELEDDHSCSTADEVCAAIKRGGWELTLPAVGTTADTWWQDTCISSEEDGEWYGQEGVETEVRPGFWFDYVVDGSASTMRYPDCAFVRWTDFPSTIGEGDGLDGLPVGWQFAYGTDAGKVEELLLAVEASWHRRRGPATGTNLYDANYVYDWLAWEEDGLHRWRFCRVFTDQWSSVSSLLCHDYTYSPERQLLAGVEEMGDELECSP